MRIYSSFEHGSAFVGDREVYFSNGEAIVSDEIGNEMLKRRGYSLKNPRVTKDIEKINRDIESARNFTSLVDMKIEMKKYLDNYFPIEADNLKCITSMRHRDDIEVSIVIPTHNRLDDLKRCINSIYEHTHGITYEIIVVEGATNNNEARDYLVQHTPIVYLREHRKVGCIRAFNIGFKFSMGEYVVWLNDDVVVEKDWLEIALKYMKENLDVGLGAFYHREGAILNANKQKLHGYIFDADDDYYCVRTINGGMKHPNMIYANFGIVKLDLMKKLGYWDDKTYKSYAADNDFSHKVWDLGMKVSAIPNARVQHLYKIDEGRVENLRVYKLECELYKDKWGKK